MILGGKDFDIDTLLTWLELENFINRTHVHGKRRGRHEETTKNLANTKVDVELQGVEMSRVE
jgi:hypothetical protein